MKTRLPLSAAPGVALAAALALAGCGGGGGGGDAGSAASTTPVSGATTEAVPPTALSTLQSFLDYQRTLQATDTIEPLTLQQQLPPTDDTIEPTPLN